MSGSGPPRLAVVSRGARRRDDGAPAGSIAPTAPVPSAPHAGAPARGPALAAADPDLALALPDGPALLHDPAGTVVAATAPLARLAGLEAPDALIGRRSVDVVVTDPEEPGAGWVQRGAADPLPVRVVLWPTVPGTRWSAVAVVAPSVAAPEDTDAVEPGPLEAVDADALRMQPGVAAERRRLDDLQRIAGVGYWEHDLATGAWTVSPVLREMLGLPDDGSRATDEQLAAAIRPEDRERLAAKWRALVSGGAFLEAEFRLAEAFRRGERGDGGGRGRLVHARGARIADRGRDGVVAGLVEDVTDRRSADVRLRASHQRFTDLLAVAPVGIALFDDGERLVKANQALCRLLGQGPEALRGRRADDLLDLAAERATRAGDPAGDAIVPLLARPADAAGSVSWSGPARALRTRERGARGAVVDAVWCELHVSVSVHDDGGATHLVVFTDVTSSRAVEASLRHQAMHDELTGLPNRRALTATVDRLLAGPTARRTGVLFCDLDNFKRVNDSLGHDAGDELLVELASRLRRGLPPGCAATRVSGDEFVVVCADVDRHGGLDALSRAVSAVLRTAVPVHGQLVRVSATVGAAVGATVGIPAGPPGPLPIDPDDDPVAQVLSRWTGDAPIDDDPTARGPGGTGDLMRFADAALFEAKSAGHGRFALADEAIMRGADEALRMETQLREAMANDELVLHFQPVVDADGTVQTAEALVRWQHPERGFLTPDKFLPAAEAADLMGDLDRWVLRAAMREAATWPSPPGSPAPSVAVNLAGLLPGDPDFLPTVRAAVDESGLPWDRLVLELVETCLADLPAHTLREMNELIAGGVRFAVDDFGTGYSSLSRLTGLPAQIVKLDRGFVRGVATGESDRAVARAVVDLTAAIGQVCVAEGVEDLDQFAVLRDLGVHAYQGWLFARAMPPDALCAVLVGGPLVPSARAG